MILLKKGNKLKYDKKRKEKMENFKISRCNNHCRARIDNNKININSATQIWK